MQLVHGPRYELRRPLKEPITTLGAPGDVTIVLPRLEYSKDIIFPAIHHLSDGTLTIEAVVNEPRIQYGKRRVQKVSFKLPCVIHVTNINCALWHVVSFSTVESEGKARREKKEVIHHGSYN